MHLLERIVRTTSVWTLARLRQLDVPLPKLEPRSFDVFG